MKKSTNKGKSVSKKKPTPKKKPNAKATTKSNQEPEGLVSPEQPLFYAGPPPAIRTLYFKEGFDKDFHPQDLLKHMQEGSSRSEICAAWGITYDRFNQWLDSYPELAEAYAMGKPAFDAYYKRALRHSAFGQMIKVRENSLFFMLKNVAGFDDQGGQHDFSDGTASDLEFVDDD